MGQSRLLPLGESHLNILGVMFVHIKFIWFCCGATKHDDAAERVRLCIKHNLENSGLDTYVNAFRTGHCPLCKTDHPDVERHAHFWHNLGLRGTSYRVALAGLDRIGVQLWERKLLEAKEIVAGERRGREARMLEELSEEVELVRNRKGRSLGVYKCVLCNIQFCTSPDGISRHVRTHAGHIANIHRFYEIIGEESVYRPQEHLVSGPGPRTRLAGFTSGGRSHTAATGWDCPECGTGEGWTQNCDGRRLSRVFDRIGSHLLHWELHGVCKEADQTDV